jgi:hypothetical protein
LLFGDSMALTPGFDFRLLDGVCLQEVIELRLFAPAAFVVVKLGFTGARVKHDRVFPIGQFHDQAGGFAAEQPGGAVRWRFEFESLTGSPYSGSVSDFGLYFHNM